MGYSAEMIEAVPVLESDDEAIAVLEASRLEAVWEELEIAQQSGGGGAKSKSWISWCKSLDEYEGTLAERIAQVLSDYGFDETSEAEGDVRLSRWGGDELGSSWVPVLKAIAVGVDPDSPHIWMMQGEDGEMWADSILGGTHKVMSVKMVAE